MNNTLLCPTCSSPSQSRFSTVGHHPSINVIDNFDTWSCENCNTVWRPACSRKKAIRCVWGGLVFAVVSIGLVHLSLIVLQRLYYLIMAFVGVFVGVNLFFHGISILRGKTGKLAILGKRIGKSKELQRAETADDKYSLIQTQVVSGYTCAVLSLGYFPPIFAFAGFLLGIINYKEGLKKTGSSQMILSILCGILGFVLEAVVNMQAPDPPHVW